MTAITSEHCFSEESDGLDRTNVVNFYFDGFLGVFDTDYNTDHLIEYFRFCEKAGMVQFRGRHDDWRGPVHFRKDAVAYTGFISDTQGKHIATALGTNHSFSAHPYLQPYIQLTENCYGLYSQKFEAVAQHPLAPVFISVQKTGPSEGYHVFHSENDGMMQHCRRQLVTMLYLNDIEEGGETEFLYQNIRIKPKRGRFLMWPSDWTYTHRGNPPLKEDKYIATSWLEYAP